MVPLPPGQLHQLFDGAAIMPESVEAAKAARDAAPAAAAAWRAMRMVELLPPGELGNAAWAEAQAMARHAMRNTLAALSAAVAAGPRATEAALLSLRDTATQLRAGTRSLSALVETRRVCRAIDAASDAILRHIDDAGVARAGAIALAGTGIWAARQPQRALAGALRLPVTLRWRPLFVRLRRCSHAPA